jgi:3-oxoadipate enol-lactonase
MYVSTRLGRWYYEEHGRARREGDAAVVLWPSFLTDGGMWDAQVAPLAAMGRVLVFDPPGHGKSEAPPPFSLDDNARALVDALDALGAKQIVMAGLSWGGMVAMRLAVLVPDRVRALALLDTSADPELRRNRVQYRPLLSMFRRVGMPAWLFERRVAPKFFAPATLRDRPQLPKELWSAAVGFSREGVYRAGKAIFGREDFTGELPRIKAPTLVMCGSEDTATPPDRSRTIASRIAGAELVMIEGAGHLSAVEQPERVNRKLVPFVDEHLTPPRR